MHARQLLAASLGLIAFLSLTGYALDHAFQETARVELQDRLQNYVKAYYRGMEFARGGALLMPDRAPDPRFERPGSGLYAGLVSRDMRWESASSLGRTLPLPKTLKLNEMRLDGPLPYNDGNGGTQKVYRLSHTTIWETEAGDMPLTFSVYEDTAQFESQLSVFRRALWGYLGMAAVLLLLVQMLVLRWSLQPLRNLKRDLDRVQGGHHPSLSGQHPPELEPITDSINALIDSERSHLEQSRNTLSDLAHSLKTPLAVLRARLDSGAGVDDLRDEVSAQVQRMNEIVSYQLSRAARSGHALFSAPIEVEPRAEEIVASLEKVYSGKGVVCEFDVDAQARFHGELGDLQELIGNLLENAFKWAARRVLLTVKVEPTQGSRRPGLLLAVEDDGPGIAAENVERLLQRGVRGDERVQGHGIGLAIVQDIVRAYRGELRVERSTELGGARFVVRIPPVI
ncbi:MAG TPA: sensor histidine kinase [Arenimonas sp.]|uniref:ATP-binding protein n=1 Tax=Arenimonas sp. TaxID=1872635 RepID=UPI002BFCA953|nr:sensor histidine kinase [Arenimonas sp.]HMB58193.1 sensor histidine kinase [Arenimonas sp.]